MNETLKTLWRLYHAQGMWLGASKDDIIEQGAAQAMMLNANSERMYWGIADQLLKLRLGRSTLPWAQ